MRILDVKTEAVTRGVLDKKVSVQSDHYELTFVDHNGTPHTVFPHKNGPFANPDDAVTAWLNGTLHGEADEQPERETPLPPAGEIVPGGPRGGEADKLHGGYNG